MAEHSNQYPWVTPLCFGLLRDQLAQNEWVILYTLHFSRRVIGGWQAIWVKQYLVQWEQISDILITSRHNHSHTENSSYF